jgi:DUF971 family protein
MTTQNSAWPLEIRLQEAGKELHISFDSGESFILRAELLRIASPSAEVRGHGAAEPQLVHGKKNVAISDIVPTGHYAIRLCFDDGHDTGIYTWRYLHELGTNAEREWQSYLNRLASKGFSR